MKRIIAGLLGLAAIYGCKDVRGIPFWEIKPIIATRVFDPLPDTSAQTRLPLSGFHQWRGQQLVPGQHPAREQYQRYYWKDLEPSDGVYNFDTILNDLKKANDAGSAFAFRIRMMAGYDDDNRYYPAWLSGSAECAASPCEWSTDVNPAVAGFTYIPDWNHPFLLDRAEAMLKALGNALPANAEIAFIDIGMYGQYGEWALSKDIQYENAPAGIIPVTVASKKAFIDMHVDAFPNRQLLMFALKEHVDEIVYARTQTQESIPSGLRVDCLGKNGFFDQWKNSPLQFIKISNYWTAAPFIGEFCGFAGSDAEASFEIALQQIQDYHIASVGNGNFGDPSLSNTQKFSSLPVEDQNKLMEIGQQTGTKIHLSSATVEYFGPEAHITLNLTNPGNAPLYIPFDVGLEMRQSGSATLIKTVPFPDDLRKSISTATSVFTSRINFSEFNPEGSFDLFITFIKRAKSEKLLFYTTAVEADSSYRVGTVVLQ